MTKSFVGFGGHAPFHFKDFFYTYIEKYGGGIPTKPTKPPSWLTPVHDFEESNQSQTA